MPISAQIDGRNHAGGGQREAHAICLCANQQLPMKAGADNRELEGFCARARHQKAFVC
jgi:hypothetical protein